MWFDKKKMKADNCSHLFCADLPKKGQCPGNSCRKILLVSLLLLCCTFSLRHVSAELTYLLIAGVYTNILKYLN